MPTEAQDQQRRLRQREALIQLARSEVLSGADGLDALRLVARTVAETLEVTRVSLWRYRSDPLALECLVLHDAARPGQPGGTVLAARDYPAYFAALASADLVAAHDAVADQRTREFARGYLDVLGISSMLDAPIRFGGELRGVVCHEQVGPPRHWQADEESFAVSVASLVALVLERGERQQIQAALTRGEADFRLLFAESPLPMWVFDLETMRFLAVNGAAIRQYGYTREEFLRMTIADIRPPEDALALRASKPLSATDLYSAGVWRHRRKDGTLLFVEITARPIDFQSRRAELILAHDVTASHEAQQALRESEARFRQLAESIQEVFWLEDVERRLLLYVSPAYATVWGRSPESLHAAPRSWLDAVHEEDRARVREAADAKQSRGTYDEEYRIVHPDGSIRWIHDKAFPIRDAAGRVTRVAGVAEDITARKDLERQFFRAQRLESIGTLASGVAHDLNNILAPVLMAAGLLKLTARAAEDANLVQVIEQSTQRGSAIVSQLLAFSRGATGTRIPVQPRQVFKEVLPLIRETFPRNIAIELDAPTDLRLISADATQLHQILMNLCVNARDAMPAGGRLELRAANVDLADQAIPGAPPAAAGPHVQFSVRDTGGGIPPAILDRIFDPFFTTKQLGKGTGLGLSTVLGITRGHGGFVLVDSSPGNTEFRIYLPALATAALAALPARPEAPRGHGELVLVVDDEAPIRATLREVLQRHGYHVLLAADGDEALRQYVAHRGAVRLVVTDFMMPGMDGAALGTALRRLSPSVRILLLSGLTGSAPPVSPVNSRALSKPCTPEELLVAVHELLNQTSAGGPGK